MKYKAITALILCAASSLAFASSNLPAKNHNSNTNNLGGEPTPIFGGGYFSQKQIPMTSSCLIAGKPTFAGGNKSVINLGNAISFSELQKDLNVNVSASGSYGMFSGSASANYARHIKQTQYSDAFYYAEQIVLPAKIFNLNPNANQPTDFLSNTAKIFYNMKGDQFQNFCGDEFINEENLGANLFVTIKLNFNSAQSKESFDANIGASFGGMFGGKASFQQQITKYNIQGDLEISAYQVGGDSTQLAKTFQKGPSGHYYVATCSLKNLSDCSGIIDGIIDYASNNFPEQIQYDPKTNTVKGAAAPIGYVYTKYTDIALKGGSPLPPAIITARKNIGDLYNKTMNQLGFVNHILGSAVSKYFDLDTAQDLKQAQSHLNYNKTLINDPNNGAPLCYSDPDRCVQVYKNLKSEMKPVNQEVIDNLNKAYLVNDGQNNYFDIPLGGTQYTSVSAVNSQVVALRVTISSGLNSLSISGTDIYGQHFNGIFSKQTDGSHEGTANYPDRKVHWIITTVSNPS